MRRKGLIVAAALVTLVNALSLITVGRNRARTVQTIELTERELPIEYQTEENSGIDLHLRVVSEGIFGGLGIKWLDSSKLRELGFDTSGAAVDNNWQHPPRPAYVALEYDGPGWQQYLEKARSTWRNLSPERENTVSHLVAVDAGSHTRPSDGEVRKDRPPSDCARDHRHDNKWELRSRVYCGSYVARNPCAHPRGERSAPPRRQQRRQTDSALHGAAQIRCPFRAVGGLDRHQTLEKH
jgi:hypothetical protein